MSIALLGLTLDFRIQGASVEVVTTDPELAGVRLMSVNDPAFDRLVASNWPGWAQHISAAKPFLVILSNNSAKRIVAFSLLFLAKRSENRLERHYSQHKFPDMVAGADGRGLSVPLHRGLLPGETRIVGWNYAFAPEDRIERQGNVLFDWIKAVNDGLTDITHLEISLDGVIFSDGTIVGPQTAFGPASLKDNFLAFVEAKNRLYLRLSQQIASGASVKQAFESLARAVDRQASAPGAYDIYDRLALDETNQLRIRDGDDAMPKELHAAIRDTVFTFR